MTFALLRSIAAASTAALLATALPPIQAAAASFGPAPRIVASAVQRYDLRDLGEAPAALPITIALTLPYRNSAELAALVEAQSSPASPLFRHYLTSEQFSAEFAPLPADYARVALTLQSAGFRILRTYPNRTVIDAVGSAAAAERLFATDLHRVAQTGHGVRYANVVAATLPAALSGRVSAVLGLDDVVKFSSHGVRAAGVPVRPFAAAATSSDGYERIVDGQFAGIYPSGIAKAYNYPSEAGKTGAGQTVAIVIDSDIAQSDLTTYWSAAGVKRTGTFSRVTVDSYPGISPDVGETAIDSEMVTSLATGANVDLYLISSLDDAPIEDAYNLAVSKRVDVASSSFGGCELDDLPFAQATEEIAIQGAAVGVTFTASSGDSGGYCEDETAAGAIYYEPDIVDNPASNPHFAAIGATALTISATTGKRTSETAWGPGGANGGSGGGVSSYWPRPSYQTVVKGIADVPKIKVSPPDSQPKGGFAGRNLPDISLDGSNANFSYVAVYDTPDGGWTGYGGTSVSNQLFAALVAERNQTFGTRSGYLNPTLYSSFTKAGADPGGVYGTRFLDITSGSTGAGWKAAAGYDQSTGIGTYLNAAE
jgi:kumamolisin